MKNKLRNILDREGLTQVKLAKLCEKYAEPISVITINKVANCKMSPSLRLQNIIVKSINEYLGKGKYTIQDIFGKDDSQGDSYVHNEGKISQELLLYLTLEGKIKPIPVFKDEMGNIIQEEKLEFYFINKKKQKYEEKAEELEYLLSQEYIKESELQKFFERNPEFILDGDYCEAIPQVILKDENEKKNIPDFILKPNENISVPAKIVELKLPNVELIRIYDRAEAFTQKITRAVGQLKKYYRYFTSDKNRKIFFEEYHFNVFYPRLALIVGKDVSDIDKETLEDLKTTFNGIDITTYNEVLSNYRQKIKHLFK